MAKTPFYTVGVLSSGRDLTESIESLTYEESVEKDDYFTVKFFQRYAANLIDDDDIVADIFLTCQYGYKEGTISTVHKVKISELEPHYGKYVSFTLKCLDQGQSMKRSPDNKIWKKLTSFEIAGEIAKRYGLKLIGDATSRVWPSYAQGLLTDFDLLAKLAAAEEGGSYVFYVRGEELHFERRDMNKSAKYIYTYNEDILDFKPKYKSIHRKGKHTKTLMDYVSKLTADKMKIYTDQLTKQPVDNTGIGNNNVVSYQAAKLRNYTEDGVRLVQGKNGYDFGYQQIIKDAKDEPTKQPVKPSPTAQLQLDILSGKFNNLSTEPIVPGSTVNNIEDRQGFEEFRKIVKRDYGLELETKEEKETAAFKSKHMTDRQNLGLEHAGKGKKILAADLKIEGNPLIRAGEIITIKNVARKYAGNWFIYCVKHIITAGGGYITELELHKNGTNKAIVAGASKHTKVNDSLGDKSSANKKVIQEVQWDANGNLKNSSSDAILKDGREASRRKSKDF